MAKLQDNPKSSTVLGLEDELHQDVNVLDQFETSIGQVRVIIGRESLWVRVLAEGKGGFALRAGYMTGNQILDAKKVGSSYEINYHSGRAIVQIEAPSEGLLRIRTSLIPSADLAIPFIPRDLYPIDRQDNTEGTLGLVHVTQSGLGCPMVYWSMTEPEVGSFLYYQHLTALNPYFNKTGTIPSDSVGGRWPELGFLPPVSSEMTLEGGKEIVVSDAIVCFSPHIPKEPRALSDLYLQFLYNIYAVIDRPETTRNDWLGLAKKALRDLEQAPTASVTYWGCKYLHPYNNAENPDSMVQLNVTHAIEDYGNWCGKRFPLRDALFKGVTRFFDEDLQTMRRFLTNAKGKDLNEVDGWYLYHPLMSLARLVRDGDNEARDLFFKALPFGMKVAHRFKYLWPVLFDVETFEVKRAERREGEPGQTDVAGLYAYVMMQAYELTDDKKYLDEAETSIRAVKNFAFNLCYQTNITAWGTAACARLYRATGDSYYIEALKVFAAAFFRHTIFWESDIGLAKNYPVFLGTLCLDQGPYMAIFECHESYEAFTECLSLCQEDLPDSVRALMAESCKYGEQRAWFYHPRFLPKEALAKEFRNGYVDRKLHFPVEDLYPDGQPAGQVGQEVYGCGAAFAYVTNSFHRTKGANFLFFCEYPVKDKQNEDGKTSFLICGSPSYRCRLEFMPDGRRPLVIPEIWIDGQRVQSKANHLVRGNSRVELRWKPKSGDSARRTGSRENT